VDLLGVERPLLIEKNLDLGAFQQTSISTAANNLHQENRYCSSCNRQLTIRNANGLNINIFSLSGQRIQTLTPNTDVFSISLEKGIYIVRSDKFTEKVMVH
jgi:hypothetical protein